MQKSSLSPPNFFILCSSEDLSIYALPAIHGMNCLSQIGKHQVFRTWTESCGIWGGKTCLLSSLTLSEGKWHTWSELCVSRCVEYCLGYIDRTGQDILIRPLYTVAFHRLEPMTSVILYIKFSQIVEKTISRYVEMLTWICESQASRPHLCSVGRERPLQQAVPLK